MLYKVFIYVLVMSFHFYGSAFAHEGQKGSTHTSTDEDNVPVILNASLVVSSTPVQAHNHDLNCGHPISAPIEAAGLPLVTSCLGPNQNEIRDRVATGPEDKVSREKAVCDCFDGENNSIRPIFREKRDSVLNSNIVVSTRAANGEFPKFRHVGDDGEHAFHTNSFGVGLLSLSGSNPGAALEAIAATVRGEARKVLVVAPSSTKELSTLDPDFFRDNTDAKNCVSYQEFFVFNQVPADNVFYTFMDQQTKFEPNEWNFNSLKKELSQLTQGKVFNVSQLVEQDQAGVSKLSHTERMKVYSIVSRLRFLNSNAVFKNLFLINGAEDSHSLEHQQKLFAQMKNHLRVPASRSCFSKSAKCRKEYTEKNSFLSFLTNAREAVMDDESLLAIRKKADEEMSAFTLKQQEQRSRSPSSINVNTLWYVHNLDQYNCDKDGFDLTQCTERWGRYCGGLADAYNDSSSPFTEGLAASLNEIYEPDLDSNRHYKAFVDFACHTPRGSKNQTFADFKNDYCRGNSSRELCAPEQRAKLVAHYLETNDSPSANNNIEINAMDTAALANFLRTVPVNSLTQAQTDELIAKSSRTQQSGPSTFNLARHGEVQTNGTSTSFSDFRAEQTGTSGAAASNGVASSASTNSASFERSAAPASSYDASPSFVSAGSVSSSSQTNFTPVPQVQRAIDENRAEASELGRRIEERTVEREQVVRQNPSDDRIPGLESDIASLKNELKLSDSKYTALLERFAADKQAAKTALTPTSANSSNSNLGDTNDFRTLSQNGAPVRNSSSPDSQSVQLNSPQTVNSSTASAISSFGVGMVRGISAPTRSSLMNSALIDADKQKSSKVESGLIVSSTSRIENQVRVAVPVEVFNLVESGNSEAIRSYASRKLSESNSNEDRVYLQVNVDGSTNNRALELVAVRQSNGEYKFFTPEQVASSFPRKGRSPASTQNKRLKHLREIVGP